MNKLKVSITGSNGFLGSHLLASLTEDFDVVCFDKTKHDLFRSDTLESFLKNTDAVVHLAGANRDSDHGLFRTNVIATAGLLEGMEKFCPNAKIIFSSSFQAYEDSAYGISKKLAEEIIKSFYKFYGIKSVILRISNIYGPGGKPFYNSVVATFTDLIRNKKPIVINGTGEQRRDYVYVGDVVDAIKKAILYNVSSFETFNICSASMTSLNEIVDALQSHVTERINISYENDSSLVREEVVRDYKDAESKLSWIPRISLKDGLKKTLANE